MEIGWCTFEKVDNRTVNSIGSSRIRGRWMWETWNQIYPEDVCEQFVIGKKYDVMVFQKVYWENMMTSYDGFKIIDLCDPDWLDGKDVMYYVGLADVCTTSTIALRDFIKKFVKTPVYYIPDRIKLDEHAPRKEHMGNARKICWMGYSQNQHYIYPCLEFLAERGLELTVISNQPYQPPQGFDFVKVINYSYVYPNVHEKIKECDLYLSPTTPDEKGRFKSNNKALTAMALGVPVVYLPEDLDKLKTAEARNAQMNLDIQEIKDKWDVVYSVAEMREIINAYKDKRGR